MHNLNWIHQVVKWKLSAFQNSYWAVLLEEKGSLDSENYSGRILQRNRGDRKVQTFTLTMMMMMMMMVIITPNYKISEQS
jgi:hypothetical protein